MKDFKVELLATAGDPQLIATAGALGCFEEDSSSKILGDLLALPAEKRDKKCEAVLKNSFGMGHGSVGDQGYFIFSIENLPRAATLQLCLPEFASHLQQSLRRAKPERGFYLPAVIKNHQIFGALAERVLSETFEFYEEMTEAGIPGEDARYLLPLYTKTNIQTALNARELCHFEAMSKKDGVPAVVWAVVREMMSLAKNRTPYLFENFGFNYEPLAWYPSSQLYAKGNKTMTDLIKMSGVNHDVVMLDQSIINKAITTETLRKAVGNRDEAELANLKHIHFEFLAKMSLACFHQATRQRTWNQSVESIYDAAKYDITEYTSRMFIPESIKNSDFAFRYGVLHQKLIGLYLLMTSNVIAKQEAIGVIPHSLMVYDWIHVNGWNAIHSIGKRRCTKAQREIRNIADAMAGYIEATTPIFRGYVEPQCVTYGKCPEKDSCGYNEKTRG